MDKKYYYRQLGLQEGVSAEKIEAAYKEKIRKLNSADYGDDPEYVQRKKQQLKEAYNVLTGRTAPVAEHVKKRRFERVMEDETSGREKSGRSRYGKSSVRTSKANNDSKEKIAFTIFAAIAFIVFFIYGFTGDTYDDYYERLYEIDHNAHKYDYSSWLDESTLEEYKDFVDWESEDDYDGIWDNLDEIAMSLEVYSFGYITEYMTGDEDFYYDNSDFECSKKVIEFMKAPSFEEVGGCRNLYRDNIILTYEDYLLFLDDVAYEQTNEIIE